MTWIKDHIPLGYQICLVADRGFGRVSFMQHLEYLGLFYVLRVKKHVTITDQERQTGLLGKRRVAAGQRLFLPHIRYRKDQAIILNIVISKAEGAKEKWFLVSNLADPQDILRRYEQRFQIEETFRDIKHQLGLEHCWHTTREQFEKWLAIVFIAFLILLWIGISAEPWRILVDARGHLSFISVAIFLLLHSPPGFGRVCNTALNQAQKGSCMKV